MFYKFESLACNVDARPHRTNTERIIEVIRREESTKLNVLMNTNISMKSLKFIGWPLMLCCNCYARKYLRSAKWVCEPLKFRIFPAISAMPPQCAALCNNWRLLTRFMDFDNVFHSLFKSRCQSSSCSGKTVFNRNDATR